MHLVGLGIRRPEFYLNCVTWSMSFVLSWAFGKGKDWIRRRIRINFHVTLKILKRFPHHLVKC